MNDNEILKASEKYSTLKEFFVWYLKEESKSKGIKVENENGLEFKCSFNYANTLLDINLSSVIRKDGELDWKKYFHAYIEKYFAYYNIYSPIKKFGEYQDVQVEEVFISGTRDYSAKKLEYGLNESLKKLAKILKVKNDIEYSEAITYIQSLSEKTEAYDFL